MKIPKPLDLPWWWDALWVGAFIIVLLVAFLSPGCVSVPKTTPPLVLVTNLVQVNAPTPPGVPVQTILVPRVSAVSISNNQIVLSPFVTVETNSPRTNTFLAFNNPYNASIAPMWVVLQSSTNLNGPVWTNHAVFPYMFGDNTVQLALDLTKKQKFFRAVYAYSLP